MSPRLWFVVPAAGASRRMGADLPKQYLECRGRTILEWALAPFVGHPRFAGGVVALAADDGGWGRLPAALRERVATTPGGRERADSVLAGLRALPAAEDDWVLVHDAARPCLPCADLDRLIAACEPDPVGGLLALPVADTLKRGDGQRVLATVPRDGLWRALTPQMFRRGLLERALVAAAASGDPPSDEAGAVERLGQRPLLVEGSALNIKVTRPSDLELVAGCLGLMGEGG
jgi:2-C-methyl-D-erythritol 4-phosphate cytidylyltransferase